jgi:DNA-binding response OmpR family regulator
VERATPVLIAAALVVLVGTALAWLWRRARRNAGRQPDTPAVPAPAAVQAVIDPVKNPTSRPARVRRLPDRHPAANPAPEPETAGVAAKFRPDSGDATADGAQVGRRHPAADRPRRAPPRRRPATSVSPPADVEPPKEEEIDEADEWLVAGRIRLSRNTGEVFSGTRRVLLTRTEFAVLELLMTRGGQGVTRDAIRAATRSEDNGEEAPDLDVILTELWRKTGIRGRGQGMRKERALVYFFGD